MAADSGPRAVILAGGRLRLSPGLHSLVRDADLVIAADSGLRHARSLPLEPDVVVGDFDSVSLADLEAHPSIERIRHPERKDELDLELAIDLAIDRGARRLVVLGAFGTRFDQSLACLLIAARLCREGFEISLHDGERDAFLMRGGDELELELPDGAPFSLLALEHARCTVSGARYPLSNAALPFGVGLGTANASQGGPRVSVHDGLVAVIVELFTETPGTRPPPGGGRS
jgi:thiamine pyrophosphokinase